MHACAYVVRKASDADALHLRGGLRVQVNPCFNPWWW